MCAPRDPTHPKKGRRSESGTQKKVLQYSTYLQTPSPLCVARVGRTAPIKLPNDSRRGGRPAYSTTRFNLQRCLVCFSLKVATFLFLIMSGLVCSTASCSYRTNGQDRQQSKIVGCCFRGCVCVCVCVEEKCCCWVVRTVVLYVLYCIVFVGNRVGGGEARSLQPQQRRPLRISSTPISRLDKATNKLCRHE